MDRRIASKICMICAAVFLLFADGGARAGQPEPPSHQRAAIREAEHRVDQAWEVFHRAALSGTVASPELQIEIEQHLHAARELVMEARAAAEQGDSQTVTACIERIAVETAEAIKGSLEQKQ